MCYLGDNMAKKINRTKLPKIVQLPSGAYHTRLFSHKDENGKPVYCSITHPDYDEVVRLAAQFKVDKKHERIKKRTEGQKITLGEAMDKYIESKDAVLSPATIREYKRMRRTYLQDIINMPVFDITQEIIQQEINALSRELAPKSVRNVHGFIVPVLTMCRPELKLTTTLPQKVKPDIRIPTAEEMSKVFAYVKGTDMEIPVYLAACCGLRRSEIIAIDVERDLDLDKQTLTIREAIVVDENNEEVRKKTKTPAGKRTIRLFPFVLDAIKRAGITTGPLVDLKGYQIYNKWRWIRTRLKLPKYRFHDLRHYAVSVMLALNIPKNYIADYVGHDTENMIDNVYGHIMRERKTSFVDMLQNYFTNVVSENMKQNMKRKKVYRLIRHLN